MLVPLRNVEVCLALAGPIDSPWLLATFRDFEPRQNAPQARPGSKPETYVRAPPPTCLAAEIRRKDSQPGAKSIYFPEKGHSVRYKFVVP